MTTFVLAASAFSPLSRPQHHRAAGNRGVDVRSHRARVALSTTHDETLRANAAKWVSSPEIKKLLRQSREGTLWDDADDDDEHGSVTSLRDDDYDDDAEIASPGRTAPAHARPLEEAPAEAAFVARALREETFLGPGDELAACKEKARRDEGLGAARARHAAAAVAQSGVARVRGALSAGTAERLRAHVVEELETLVAGGEGMSEEDGFRLVAVGSGTQRLSALVGEDEADLGETETRWDIRLDSGAAPVRAALRELLADDEAPLGRAFAAIAGADATLWECAAIVSAPGAAPQILHADATHTPEPLLVTAFVALQDVRREMGPTRFVRGTHTEPGPAAVLADGDALGLADAKGRPPPSCVALLKAGEAALYDGRLLHCGGANRSDELRILFYLTFRAATDDGVGGAEALEELQGSLREE